MADPDDDLPSGILDLGE